MKAKIRVYGKSQSRTVLGIINAYLKLYPDSTLSDLQQAFPKSLNPKSFTDNIIVREEETRGQEKSFFEKEDELIVLKNGERLALVEVWRKEDFDAICDHAKQYGIKVAKMEGSKPFEKGSYELEYLDESVTPAGIVSVPEDENEDEKKRKFKCWWILLLILLLSIVLLCWNKCCSSDKCSNRNTMIPVEKIVPPSALDTIAPAPAPAAAVDNAEAKGDSLANNLQDTGNAISMTLPDGKKWQVEKNSSEFKLFSFLHSAEAQVDPDKSKGWVTLDKISFETGKVKHTPEGEKQLGNVAAIMKLYPNAHIKVGGYTDNTGSDKINMRLSTERAKVTAEKLISLGLEANRVAYEGYGSQFPVCPPNDTKDCRAANRRVDVKVTQK